MQVTPASLPIYFTHKNVHEKRNRHRGQGGGGPRKFNSIGTYIRGDEINGGSNFVAVTESLGIVYLYQSNSVYRKEPRSGP